MPAELCEMGTGPTEEENQPGGPLDPWSLRGPTEVERRDEKKHWL